MPLATPETYAAMLDRARERGFALPAVAVSSSETVNAALRGFAEASSDGIIQISPSAAAYAAGACGDMVAGALALAAHTSALADRYPIQVALHTDHCPKAQLESFFLPLLHLSTLRVREGDVPIFNSQMFDGSALPIGENLELCAQLLAKARVADVILEIEVGVLGADGYTNRRTSTTPQEFVAVVDQLGLGERGRYLLAPSFGNVHGVSAGGRDSASPDVGVLDEGLGLIRNRFGRDTPLYLVFHGGSGCDRNLVRSAIARGVVKFNVDTDLQRAYSGAVVRYVRDHLTTMSGTPKETAEKRAFDPRTYGRLAEEAMAARVASLCAETLSAAESVAL